MTQTGEITPDGAVDLIETDYEIGQHNIQTTIGRVGVDIHSPVFPVSRRRWRRRP